MISGIFMFHAGFLGSKSPSCKQDHQNKVSLGEYSCTQQKCACFSHPSSTALSLSGWQWAGAYPSWVHPGRGPHGAQTTIPADIYTYDHFRLTSSPITQVCLSLDSGRKLDFQNRIKYFNKAMPSTVLLSDNTFHIHNEQTV